jgi:predicted DNA binding protein
MSSASDSGVTLAPVDRQLFETALEQGYFESPASTDVSALAGEFDLSERETRRRLARTMATVLRAYRSDTDDVPLGTSLSPPAPPEP